MRLHSEPATDLAGVVDRLRGGGCIFAEDEAALILAEARTAAEVNRMVTARVRGAPLEQILGWAEFAGHRVVVEPGVFVPRRRTELLVRTAIGDAPARPVVVDLCCGTGAIGLAIAAAIDGATLHATDIDPVAVHCARRNLGSLGTVHEGDLFDRLPGDLRHRVDVLAVNAPYVPSGEIELMPAEAREYEHRMALDGGADGLDVHRRVAAGAGQWLAPNARLLIEVAEIQVPTALAILEAAGLTARVVRSAELDATIVVARSR